jgi:NAD(P)-dependent dehydrogenase (short-subunit alcohol dehydrogenase family)
MIGKKLAVITGSAGDIGLAICSSLNKDGFLTLGIDLEASSCDENLAGDVRELSVISAAVNVVNIMQPSFLVLVNNAGLTVPNDNSLEAWDETIGINLSAPYFWMSEFSKYFEENNVIGSIINITSLAAELAFPNNPAYMASKGGLKQLTKAFALKLGPIGVTCNNVGPGYIKTKFNSGSLSDPEAYLKRSERSMLNRWGQASEVADAVSFLASDKARFITGQDIYVDGGWLAQGLH